MKPSEAELSFIQLTLNFNFSFFIIVIEETQNFNCMQPNIKCDASSYQEEIKRLSELEPTQCIQLQIKNGNEEKLFQSCKSHLEYKIRKKCEDIEMNDPGMFFYRKDRGYFTCCFRAL